MKFNIKGKYEKRNSIALRNPKKPSNFPKYGKLVPMDFLMYGIIFFPSSSRSDGYTLFFPTHGY